MRGKRDCEEHDDDSIGFVAIMHPFQLAFQHLFSLCMYYLLVVYIQKVSSVAAVSFFFCKNGNCQSLEYVKDYGVAWPVFSASFVWHLSRQQPWEAVLNSHLALCQYTKHNPSMKDLCGSTSLCAYCAASPCSLYLWTAWLTLVRLLPSPSKSLFLQLVSSCHPMLI